MRDAILIVAVLTLSVCGCSTNRSVTQPPRQVDSTVSSEVAQQEFLASLVCYLYNWEGIVINNNVRARSIEVWLRSADIKTDEGDNSRFAEVWLPKARVLVYLKKAKHSVPERHLTIHDDRYRVFQVEHRATPPNSTQRWSIVKLPLQLVYSKLRSMSPEVFPSAAVESRVRQTLANWLQRWDPGSGF